MLYTEVVVARPEQVLPVWISHDLVVTLCTGLQPVPASVRLNARASSPLLAVSSPCCPLPCRPWLGVSLAVFLALAAELGVYFAPQLIWAANQPTYALQFCLVLSTDLSTGCVQVWDLPLIKQAAGARLLRILRSG